VLLTDVAQVQDSVENLRNLGLSNGKPAVLLVLYRKSVPTSSTVDRVKAIPPQLEAGAIKIDLAMDRTATINLIFTDPDAELDDAAHRVPVRIGRGAKKHAGPPHR
jgi:multidrug efflux pump